MMLSMAPRVGAAGPNIIHIIADDLGWNDVGFHGSDISTPHIDRLAKDSVILNRFYVTPICSPTRAGALTGRYPFRYGIWGGVVSPTKRHGLPAAEVTTAELLAEAGYERRALMGKWHLGLASTMFHPLRHGFTSFYGHYNGAIDYFSRERFGQLDWHVGYESVIEEGYSTDLIGRAAVRFIKDHRGAAPFFLMLTFNAPHSPLQAKRDDLDRYGFDPDGPRAPNTDAGIAKREKAPEYGESGKGNTRRQTFAAMTTALDRNIGAVLKALDERGLRDNTLVVFHSDNGADPRHGGSNTPLRGNKFTTWEGGTRVVAMVRWPERLRGGRDFDRVTGYIDLLPTFAAAAGVEAPKNVDGVNLLPHLTGIEKARDRFILLDAQTVVTDRWKLRGNELFDLLTDPNETTDIAAEHSDRVTRLKKTLSRYESMVGPATESGIPMPESWPPKRWRLPEEPGSE
jgi:arylsulfatase B